MTTLSTSARRRPVEAIHERASTSAECEQRVRRALSRLLKAGVPFTVQDVCTLAGVGRTFIYDKRRPALTRAVLEARDASQDPQPAQAGIEDPLNAPAASWRERAMNAEALAKSLREKNRELETQLLDLTGQLYDREGSHLADRNAELRALVATQTVKLNEADLELAKLRRSLDASRANVLRERERQVARIGVLGSVAEGSG